jgi:cytochrome c oxidase subunit II
MSDHVATEKKILKTELRWAIVVAGIVLVIMSATIFAAISMHINPPSNREYIDPRSLHLSGEFTEANLGTRVDPNGQVTTRIIATQFAFVPQCVVVPADRQVTLRFATPDVIHGILVSGTNVNTMVVPGYVSQVHTVFRRTGDLLMPCHEYCGFGHTQMLATVRVVPADQFRPGPDGSASCG